MKKSVFTTIAVAALVFGIGTSAFAKTPSRSNPHAHPMASERNCDGRNPMRGEQGKADLFGMVSAVSSDNKTLTVKDADGNETQVHVNPFTHVHALPTQEERNAATAHKKPDERKFPEESALSLSDVKVGDWLMVKKLGGETKTLEAARIIVAKEK